MSEEEQVQQLKALMRQTPLPGWQTWWLSFAEEGAPEGEGFMGVCVVQIPEEEYTEGGGTSPHLLQPSRCRISWAAIPAARSRATVSAEDADIFPRLVYSRLMNLDELTLRSLI